MPPSGTTNREVEPVRVVRRSNKVILKEEIKKDQSSVFEPTRFGEGAESRCYVLGG